MFYPMHEASKKYIKPAMSKVGTNMKAVAALLGMEYQTCDKRAIEYGLKEAKKRKSKDS